MAIRANNNVEIIASPSLIDSVLDWGNSHKIDTKTNDSYHIRNNFFTPFYTANKDFELEQVMVMLESISDLGIDFAKTLVENITQLPNYQRTLVLSGISNAKSQEWLDIASSIEKQLNVFVEQSNMYFDARHQTNRNPDFDGAPIPEISDIELIENADEDGNSKLIFSYPSRYAPSHEILIILANAINQRQNYNKSKNPDDEYQNAYFNCFSTTEDGFMSRFELFLTDSSITTTSNEDYTVADVYGFTEDSNEFKQHINEITENSGYKQLDESTVDSIFNDTLNHRTVPFTDYTHDSINIPYHHISLEPTQNKLLDNLKKLPISDSYFQTLDLLIKEAEESDDNLMREYWFSTKNVAMQLYMDITSAPTTDDTTICLPAINRVQSSFTNQINKHVFDRLIDFTIMQGVLQLDSNTPNTPSVIELIDKAIILYKNEGFRPSSSEEYMNADLIKSLELCKSQILSKPSSDSKSKKAIRDTNISP